jgi:hypothetical protein
VVLTAAALPPGGCLPPIDLTERGAVTGIQVRAFNAGRLAHSIGDRLAAAACAGTVLGWVLGGTVLCWRWLLACMGVSAALHVCLAG